MDFFLVLTFFTTQGTVKGSMRIHPGITIRNTLKWFYSSKAKKVLINKNPFGWLIPTRKISLEFGVHSTEF